VKAAIAIDNPVAIAVMIFISAISFLLNIFSCINISLYI